MGYSSQHILSAQALDIGRYVIVGLLQLVIVYRDHFKGRYYGKSAPTTNTRLLCLEAWSPISMLSIGHTLCRS